MQVLMCLLVVVAGALGKAAPGFPSGRIVGGHDAARNQYPFQVSVQFCISTFVCQHSCGGVIISPTAILTAGHCVTGAPSLGTYRILAGVLNLDDNNPEREFVPISYVIVHPDYDDGINPHDLAVLKLSTPLEFNSAVSAANLPLIDYHITGAAKIIGWGAIASGEMPTRLQSADIQIISSEECMTALETLLGGAPYQLTETTNICTGPLTAGTSMCTGDSGGPLIYTTYDNTTEVIGISSWGFTPCGIVGAPSVYVNSNSYLPWIRSHMFN